LKRALVIINTVQDSALRLFKKCLEEHPEFKPTYLTFSSVVEGGLTKLGFDCICLEAEQPREGEQSVKRSCEIMLDSRFEKAELPGTTLPLWSVLFWDRLLQFVNTNTRDNQLRFISLIDFQLLVVPFDGFDPGSQVATLECIRNGIPRIGVQTSFLRTKEMLDTPLDFNEIYVETCDEAAFLEKNKLVRGCNIRVLEENRDPLPYLQARKTFRLQRSEILSKFRLNSAATTLLLVFSIRHIWELRQALRNLEANYRAEIDRGELSLAIYAESDVELRRFPALFGAALSKLSLKLVPPTQELLMLMCSVDSVIAFRVGQLTDLAGLCGIPTTVFDPSLFNRSDLLLPVNSGVYLHTSNQRLNVWNP
jgi:hypothetical protein